MNIKKYILNILNILIKPFYGTGIGKYPFFKQMFFLYEFLYKNLKSNGEILINTKYNTKMYVSTNGDFVEKDLIIKGVWEKYITNIIINNINIGDTFVDLGTNIGYYSLIVSKKVGGKGQVISFEPAKENIDKLKKNIKVNELTNIKLYECGVGNKNEEIKIYFDKNNPGGTSGIKRDYNKSFKTEKIKIVILDEILKNEKVDFIKMDIEGYEYNAILGMQNILKNNTNIKLLFEFSPIIYKNITKNYKDYSINLLNTLHSYGFTLFHIDEKYEKINKIKDFKKYLNNIKRQSNILCIKKKNNDS